MILLKLCVDSHGCFLFFWHIYFLQNKAFIHKEMDDKIVVCRTIPQYSFNLFKATLWMKNKGWVWVCIGEFCLWFYQHWLETFNACWIFLSFFVSMYLSAWAALLCDSKPRCPWTQTTNCKEEKSNGGNGRRKASSKGQIYPSASEQILHNDCTLHCTRAVVQTTFTHKQMYGGDKKEKGGSWKTTTKCS